MGHGGPRVGRGVLKRLVGKVGITGDLRETPGTWTFLQGKKKLWKDSDQGVTVLVSYPSLSCSAD